jgi:hypothetical protein
MTDLGSDRGLELARNFGRDHSNSGAVADEGLQLED